ncbi:MAG TPA: hypothetical protein VGF38_10050 [Ktedonobacterales bacterium]|jgi:hypothetical protein
MLRRPTLCLAFALTLVLTLALAGCADSSLEAHSGNTPTVDPFSTTPASAASPTTASNSSQPTVTPNTQNCASGWSRITGLTHAGDLLFEPTIASVDIPLQPLPAGAPLQPLKIPAQDTTGQYAGWPTATIGATSLLFAVCNASTSTAHTIQGARVKLTNFVAYTSQLNVWDYCDGFYARPAGVTANNCDRGSAPVDEQIQAAFTSVAQPGTVVTASQPNTQSGSFGSLPAALPPGSVMYLNVAITAPTAPGTYTFAVAPTADGASFPFTNGVSLLLAPIVHHWNGQACTTSGMLAQIPPATNPPTGYICPES